MTHVLLTIWAFIQGLTLAKIWIFGTSVVTICSAIYTFFPQWESFADYPNFQRRYKFFMLCIVKFGSGNARSTVYPDVAAKTNQGGTATK